MSNSQFSYWQKQTAEKPLFPNIEWSKPEQRARAGKLAILGGNKLGFAAVAESYGQALKTGIGECRVILPDALKKAIPPGLTDTIFVPTNPSGGISKESQPQVLAALDWANMALLVGDVSKNSETAIVYEKVLQTHDTPAVITRDAIDILRQNSNEIVARENTLLVVSFAQIQKLFQAVYYPKVLTFSMQLTSLIEALHKFTVTHPVGIVTFHNGQLIVAEAGQVSTTPLENPMDIWRGILATKISVYWSWNLGQLFQAASTSALAG